MTTHQPHREPGQSALMEIALEETDPRSMRVAICIALYAVLAMIWMPGFTINNTIPTATEQPQEPKRRQVLRPPPEKPIDTITLREKKARKMPLPDRIPEEPEVVIPPDPIEVPEFVANAEPWEIGIPTSAPERCARRCAGAGRGDHCRHARCGITGDHQADSAQVP